MRKRFRLVLVMALALAGGALVAPSAVASLSGSNTAAMPFRSDDDHTGDKPKVSGRNNDNHDGEHPGSGCFYPPSRQPRINLYDFEENETRSSKIRLKGKVSVASCGIEGMDLILTRSDSGGGGWRDVAGPISSDRSGNFTFKDVSLLSGKNFFQVVSKPKYGFNAASSNVIKVKRK